MHIARPSRELQAGQGRRVDMIGSLLLGVWDGPGSGYAGHVGTGFTQAMLTDLARQLTPLRRAASTSSTTVPAQHACDARRVEPQLAGKIAFTEVRDEYR
jgi:bifunctional non-homologous end joining protein LigD